MTNAVNNYSDDDAVIKVNHTNGNSLYISIHPMRPVRVYLATDGRIPETIPSFLKAFSLDPVIVPTLGPFESREPYLQDETVQRNENTRLAHRNFRNIVYRFDANRFDRFSHLVNAAWPGVEILKPELSRGDRAQVDMFFSEGRMDREIYWAGFGFQVWMQMMLQVIRGNKKSLFVMDEPDIYLHPDLQRKLFRLLRDQFGQLVIATHSTEIINEADGGDILSVSRNFRSARRVNSEESYRQLFDYLGSSENAEFSRLARAKRIVFFEGHDKRIIRRFAAKVNLPLLDDPDTIFLQAGGFSQLKKILEVNWTLSKVFGMDVRIAAIFDRDYRCATELSEFEVQMKREGISCYVLARKEIENYFLEIPVLTRALQRRARERGIELEDVSALNMIELASREFHNDAQGQILAHYMRFMKDRNKDIDESTLIKTCLVEFTATWSDLQERLKLLSGKEFISVLSARCQANYGFSTSIAQISNEFRTVEVPEDLVDRLMAIEAFFEAADEAVH